MVILDGMNVPKGFSKITINGAWIEAKRPEKKYTESVRGADDDDWYDEKHSAVMTDLARLERSLAALLEG